MPDASSAASQPVAQPSFAPKVRQPSKPKATAEQSAEILKLFREGMSIKDIARKLDVNGQSVNGIISSARRRGLLNDILPPGNYKPVQLTSPMAPILPVQPPVQPQVQAPVPPVHTEQVIPPMNNGNQQQPAPTSYPSPQDDFTGGRPIVGTSGGFMGSNQAVKYTVERISPPDGLLGTHYGSFTIEELGQNYGEGQYKVTKHDPTSKFALEFYQKIGPTYGPSKSPTHRPAPAAAPVRQPFFNRSWAPAGTQPASEEEGDPRPAYRPQFVRPEGDRYLAELARSQHAASQSGMDKAIEMMGNMHIQSMQQLESARKGGPESMVTGILREQQEIANRRWEEENARNEQRRKDEEEKWQRRQDDEQRRWERDQQAERDRHQRELERIGRETEAREKQLRLDAEEREKRANEERRFLLDLEEKKIQLVRQEAEAAQKRLESELQRSREEMKDMSERTNKTLSENQEATARHIEESQKQIQEQLDREREQLEREHKLKEKALDKEHMLENKLLEIQKEHIQSSGGDQILSTINTVIKEISKVAGSALDLKKYEILSPEAQAAEVARRGVGGPAAPEAAPARQVPPPQPSASESDFPVDEVAPVEAAPTSEPTAQAPAAAPAKAPEKSPGESFVENRMESMIRENLQKPFFQEVLKEWALHVDDAAETGSVDATTFANLYLEMMRDPRNDEARQGCAAFATFMKPRSWKKMLAVFEGAVDPQTKATFEKPEAEEFYKQFKAMVLEQITEYWEQFLASRQQKGGNGNGHGLPVPPAPVEPSGTSQAKSPAPNGQTP